MIARILRFAVVALLGTLGPAPLASGQSVTYRVETAQGQQWPTESAPRPLEARPIKFPPYEIRKLPNGLQVVLVSQHEQPAVSVRMIVRAGAAQDPKGKLGVAMMTSALLDQGAANRTAEQIADEIDFAGGILGTGAGTDLTYINTIVMKDGLELGLRLMADVVRRPTFAPDEIERQRQQALSSLKVAGEDPDNVASQVIDRLIYGFHPYGLPGSGTPESLAGLTRQDIVDFHRQYYVPNNALLAIVGDVGADEAMAGVQRAFGDWESRDVPAPKPMDPPQPTKRVIVIDKPDAVQTEIRVGHIGIPRKHNDYIVLDQTIKILGGEGANRLQQVLRSQRSLTYGASADLETYKLAGGIVAETDTRTSATAETLRAMVDEFYRLQRERIYEAELDGAQAYMVGHFPLTVETPDAIATQVLNQLFYELPLEELQTYRERMLSVTPDDVQRAARAYLKPDRLSVVLVGNANAFANDLKGVGFGDFERIPIEQVDLLAADLKKPRRTLTGPQAASVGGTDAASFFRLVGDGPNPRALYQTTAAGGQDDQAKQLVRKAIDAMGGIDKVSGVRTLVAEADTTLTTPAGKVAAKTKTYFQMPDRIRVEARLPDTEFVQIYADGQAWLKDPTGVHEAPPDMLNDFRGNAHRTPFSLLLGAVNGKFPAEIVGEEGYEGRSLKLVAVSEPAFPPVRLHLDASNGTLVKMSYERGQGGKVEEIFSDYRPVDGVSLSYKSSIVRNGVVVIERVLTDVKLNVPIASELFAKPK